MGLSHQRSHRAPGSLKERAKRPNRETPAPRCHSETELETRVLKPQVEKHNPGRFWKQFWKSWFISKSSGTRELLKNYGPQTLWDLTSKILNRLQTHILGPSDLRFEDSEVMRSSDQGPGWSRGFWLAWQLNEV